MSFFGVGEKVLSVLEDLQFKFSLNLLLLDLFDGFLTLLHLILGSEEFSLQLSHELNLAAMFLFTQTFLELLKLLLVFEGGLFEKHSLLGLLKLAKRKLLLFKLKARQ